MDFHAIQERLKRHDSELRIHEGVLEVKNKNKLNPKIIRYLQENETMLIELACKINNIIIPDFSTPYLFESRELRIPFDCHPRHKYWLDEADATWLPVANSMSLHEILRMLKAPEEIIEKYIGKSPPGDKTWTRDRRHP